MLFLLGLQKVTAIAAVAATADGATAVVSAKNSPISLRQTQNCQIMIDAIISMI